MLGVSIGTLRRWGKEGRLQPDEITPGGHRRYDLVKLRPELFRLHRSDRKTVAYARVSSHDQKEDLARQKQILEMYCASQGWTFEEDLAKDVLKIITVSACAFISFSLPEVDCCSRSSKRPYCISPQYSGSNQRMVGVGTGKNFDCEGVRKKISRRAWRSTDSKEADSNGVSQLLD